MYSRETEIPSVVTLSVVVPCYNEENTLNQCVDHVLALRDSGLKLEIVIVDDCSNDRSLQIANELASHYQEVRVLHHTQNRGKGAALRTGIRETTGDFVAVQDADLEYNPQELRDLIKPLQDGRADVVIGSRFKGAGPHRVLYFWHYLGNVFLTLFSNMLTDLNLTDMESCYKVFRREIIQSIDIEEDRFGFEPEIVAKIAHRRLRVYEMAISYQGRTYEEGKKITWKDGVRALYCIFRYNAVHLPLPVQFLTYATIGSAAAFVNLISFLVMLAFGVSLSSSAVISFALAAATNYLLCIKLLFRHRARWSATSEVFAYALLIALVGILDLGATMFFYVTGAPPWLAKSLASLIGLSFNFLGRRFVVF